MASEVLLEISKDEAECFRLMSEEKAMLDHQSRMTYAKREGLEIGMEKGMVEGKNIAAIEIAEKMKNMNMPFDEITKITGVSEEILKNL